MLFYINISKSVRNVRTIQKKKTIFKAMYESKK